MLNQNRDNLTTEKELNNHDIIQEHSADSKKDDDHLLQEKQQALISKIERIQAELTSSKEKFLRAHAEVENIRKRSEKEIRNIHLFSLESFSQALLPVFDSMEKGIDSAKESGDTSSILEGMQLTLKMICDVFNKFGITQIKPAGELFNPDKHEAISIIADDTMENDTIVEVVQTGYSLNGRIIRPARVVIVKNNK